MVNYLIAKSGWIHSHLTHALEREVKLTVPSVDILWVSCRADCHVAALRCVLKLFFGLLRRASRSA
jgi:hypothetical protein